MGTPFTGVPFVGWTGRDLNIQTSVHSPWRIGRDPRPHLTGSSGAWQRAGGPANWGGKMRYLVRMTIDIEEAIGKGTEKPEIKSRQVKEIASSQPPAPISPPMKLLLGIKEVAAALSISRSLVYILMNDGHLPFVKVGKRTMFSVQAIQECLSQRLPPFDSIGKR